MTRRWAGAAAAVLFAAALGHAQAEDWRHWKFSAPIEAGDTAAERLVGLTVPIDAVNAARPGLGDVRVVDDERREVPYALRARIGGRTAEWRESRLLEPSRAVSAFAQVVADTGEQARVHNAARLAFGSTDDFLSWVEVAVSDDARAWRVLRERAPIYQLRAEAMGEQLTVTYPETPARYLRLRVLDGEAKNMMQRVETAYEVVAEPDLVPAPLTFAAAVVRPQQSAWVASGAPHLPIAAVSVTTSQAQFDRPLSVETSDDGAQWRHLTSGQIYRVVERGQPRVSLQVKIPETSAAYWRVTVFNRNDAPLPDAAIQAQTIPRRVVFRQQPGRRYALLYGNDDASSPQYELTRLTDAAALDAAVTVPLSGAVANTNYADPAPWTERHPMLVWSGLIAVVAALGLLALRTLKSA